MTTCQPIPADSSTQELSTEETSPDSSLEDTDSSSLNNPTNMTNAQTSTNDRTVLDSVASSQSSSESPNERRSKFSGIPKLDSEDWYKHSCFKRYWDHHKYVKEWYRKHCHVYKSLLQKKTKTSPANHTSSYLPNPYQYQFACSHPYQRRNFRQTSNSKRKEKKKSGKSGRPQPKERSAPTKRKQTDIGMEVESEVQNGEETMSCEGETQEETDDKFQMDISEEMLDFFAKTQQHRKEREAEKKAEKQKMKEEKRVNIEDVSGQQKLRTSDAPKERPGSRRTSEMKMLYGKGAAMIHGMETALQMTYDRNFDAKQPIYWPNMPLRIVFADT